MRAYRFRRTRQPTAILTFGAPARLLLASLRDAAAKGIKAWLSSYLLIGESVVLILCARVQRQCSALVVAALFCACSVAYLPRLLLVTVWTAGGRVCL